MLPDPQLALWLVLLGGWVAADGTSFGQIMISRPFVAATLAGWIVGHPAAGAMIGVVLEAFDLTVLPVGAARHPEGGPAAVVSGALYAGSAHLPSTMLVCIGFALVWEWVGGESMRYMRHLNVRVLATRERSDPAALQQRHLGALAIDFARGMVLTATGLLLLAGLLGFTTLFWDAGERLPRLAGEAVLAGLLASTLRLFHGRTRLFAAGVAAGLLIVWVRS